MKSIRPVRVTVLCNVPETEGKVFGAESDEDTYDSAMLVVNGLEDAGYQVELKSIDKNSIDDIKFINSDAVFNLIEWTGKDMVYAVKAFRKLEGLGIPFTGSDTAGMLWSADKIKMKRRFEKFGIPSPRYRVFETAGERIGRPLEYPVIVKPAYEHCGIGVTQNSVVDSTAKLKSKVREGVEMYAQPMIAEEYVAGRELHVTILETRGKPWVLPPAEVTFADIAGIFPIMTYDMKWNDKSPEFMGAGVDKVPELPAGVMAKIRLIAKKCYRSMGARDYSRLDIRLKGDEVYVLEINNNPGIDFEPESGITTSAKSAGFTFETLLAHIVENAIYRYYMCHRPVYRYGADGGI